MSKEIICGAEPYENNCEKLRRLMDDDKFIYYIVDPDVFIKGLLPSGIHILNDFNPDEKALYVTGNARRIFILKTLRVFHFEEHVTIEFIN